MDPELREKIEGLEGRIDALRVSVEKVRKYFQMTLWASVIFFIMPLLALTFVVPKFLSSYLGSMNEGGVDLGGLQGLKELQDLQNDKGW